MHVDARVLVIVEPGAAQFRVFELEPERTDQVQLRAGVRAQPDHVAGVRRNLRLEEDDMQHAPIISAAARGHNSRVDRSAAQGPF